MRPEELLALLRQRPFQPFRVHLADGRVFDIRYPEMNIVGESICAFGIPEANVPDPFAERMEIVSLEDIRRVKMDGAAASTPPT